MLRVTQAEHLGGYRIRLEFNDGFAGVVNLEGELNGPVFLPLKDPAMFRQFDLTDHTIVWANGADLAPEYLYDLVKQAGPTDATL